MAQLNRRLQNTQDMSYWFDEQGRVCVDIYAKALNILDGDNPDCWKYQIVQKNNAPVHYAQLLSDTQLEVKGEHSPVVNLSPMTQYNVYFDFKLMHNAKGFQRPITFEFTDQNGNPNRFPLKLTKGDMQVLVGQFISTPSFQNVKVKMYDYGCQEKSGLLLRCVSIMPADD